MMSQCREGSVFAVPLRSGGYAIGVIACVSCDNSGGVLGYFFGPRLANIPNGSGEIFLDLKPRDALKVLRFGDFLILNKSWPVIGEITDWRRENWPMPDFVRKDEISKKAWRARYSEDDVCKLIGEWPEPYDSSLDRDAVFGAGAVELLLTRLLS